MIAGLKIPILGIAAFSGTGKTTLLLKLLPLLQARGLRVGMVKHAHHNFEIDHAGKDSYALRKSGAKQIIVGSRTRWAMVCEHQDHGEPKLIDLLNNLHHDSLDLILVEGFKNEHFPKLEVHRPSLGHALLFPTDRNVVAIAHDGQLPIETQLPRLDINKSDDIADFISEFVAKSAARQESDAHG